MVLVLTHLEIVCFNMKYMDSETHRHDNYINHFKMSLLFDTPQECLVKTAFKDSCATLFFTLPASSI